MVGSQLLNLRFIMRNRVALLHACFVNCRKHRESTNQPLDFARVIWPGFKWQIRVTFNDQENSMMIRLGFTPAAIMATVRTTMAARAGALTGMLEISSPLSLSEAVAKNTGTAILR